MVVLRIVELVACLAVAIVATGCGPASPPAEELPASTAPVESREATPTPTMSPEVAREASTCGHNLNYGQEISPGRITDARYSDGSWTVAVEGGFWGPTAFGPPPLILTGTPTEEPWREIQFVVSCTKKIDAATGHVTDYTAHLVTATPPPQ